MHNATHPEIEERHLPAATVPEIFPCNAVLREKLLALREEPGWSNSILAKRLGYNPAVISQYLSADGCIYPGDVPKFERSINDLLDNYTRRRASGVDTADCGAAEQVRIGIEYIRKTNDIGLILDESGGGKTRGFELYAKKNPTAILFKTYSWACNRKAAEKFMFDLAGKTGYDHKSSFAIHAVNKLRGSERPILVDDAHFLHFTALKWWIDFAEATQMPLILGGTYKLLDVIEQDDQIFSRVGEKWEIKKVAVDGSLIVDRELIKHLVTELLPAGDSAPGTADFKDLLDLCEQVSLKHGHYRSVHKQLKLAVEIKAGKKSLTWPQAFRSAHTMLVRNYDLN